MIERGGASGAIIYFVRSAQYYVRRRSRFHACCERFGAPNFFEEHILFEAVLDFETIFAQGSTTPHVRVVTRYSPCSGNMLYVNKLRRTTHETTAAAVL